ncbi:alpha/beta hydrolase [Thalassococcus sp. CAU 1522]|uniref:Alpha/beta hydrolase n=1 Tax=Thalassococcus arenae TaxID=2851652 RepID=A0ABS6N8P1_9RHOB|nr:alpha/beta hydrolase [Thalassococcus arenae]MBV2359964.1 alpha/beta hydrolase [Thalassococcus arenae]
MSLIRPILNAYLRLTEKPHMRRAQRPEQLRRPFEIKARLFFHGPRGVAARWDDLGAVAALELEPATPRDGPTILYFHGGGYVFGSPNTHRAMLAQLVRRTGLSARLPRYRLAPEHPFPAALEDALSAYDALAAQAPGGIVLGGDSAGGGLALALLGEILSSDRTPPLGLFAFAPLTDMGFTGASVRDNAESEVVLAPERASALAEMVLQGADPDDPRASPLHMEFTGAPPVWLAASDTEILLDDTRRLTARMRAQGVPVDEIIEHDLPHVWPIFHNLLPEARATLDQVAGWISSLSRPSAGS